jgi:hypothetical protein
MLAALTIFGGCGQGSEDDAKSGWLTQIVTFIKALGSFRVRMNQITTFRKLEN